MGNNNGFNFEIPNNPVPSGLAADPLAQNTVQVPPPAGFFTISPYIFLESA